jgi:hypothetical protein
MGLEFLASSHIGVSAQSKITKGDPSRAQITVIGRGRQQFKLHRNSTNADLEIGLRGSSSQ